MSSFAMALLSGFVKQAKSDVSLEQKKRDADDARLAQLEDLVFGAALDPKKNISKKLTAVLQEAKTDLDNREPIDLLGTPSERLRLNLKDVQQMINEADDKAFISIGPNKIQFPVSADYYDTSIIKNPEARSSYVMDSIRNLGKSGIRTLFPTAADKKAFDDFYYAELGSFVVPKIFDENKQKLIRKAPINSIYPEHDWASNIYEAPKKKSEYAVIRDGLMKENRFTNESIILPLSITGENAPDGIVSMADLDLDAAEVANLMSLAKDQGYGDLGEFIYANAQKAPDLVSFVTDINHIAALYKLNARQPKSEEQKQILGKYLIEKGYQDRPLAAAHLLVPIIKLNRDEVKEKLLKKFNLTQYQDEGNYDATFKKFTGRTLAKHDEVYAAVLDSDTKLRKLATLLEKSDLKPEGFVTTMYEFARSIFGDGGSIDQALNLINGVNDENRDAIRNTLSTEFAKYGDDERGKRLKQIAVLKYIIAADLARAEDENGRLSDQDLQRNVNKLGGFGLTVLGDARTSVAEVQKIIKTKLDGLKVTQYIRARSAATGIISLEDKKLAQADMMARSYIMAYERTTSGTGDAPVVTPSQVNVNELDTDKYRFEQNLVGKNGVNVVYQDKTTENYVVYNPRSQTVVKVVNNPNLLMNDVKFVSKPLGSDIIGTEELNVPENNTTPQVQGQGIEITDDIGNWDAAKSEYKGQKGTLEMVGNKYIFKKAN